MEFSVLEDADGLRRVTLSGRMDAAGIKEIEEAFNRGVGQGDLPVVVDMGGVTFMASMGMGLLLRNARELAAKDRRLVLYRPQELVEEVMHIAGLGQLIPIEHDEAKAAEQARQG
ncbi:MAG: STAS domain-containing protein [Desulfovibrio sp.]|jgi:anti-anti-sigma factor|nr:STAS domain-containing protein [Desulfovibrio sp.]